MEHLPSEVLVMILDKLASQDTPSSLRATWACKYLYSVGKEASHVWKRAFLPPLRTAFDNIPKLPSEDLCSVHENLDAEVEALGGYKLLLAAKLGHAVRVKNALSARQLDSPEKDANGNKSPGQPTCIAQSSLPFLDCSPSKSKLAGRVLILVRVHNVLLAYGVYNPQDETDLKLKPRFYNRHGILEQVSVALQLQPMTAIGTQDVHAKLLPADGRLFDPRSTSLEFYGGQKLPSGAEGTEDFWCGTFAVREGLRPTGVGVGDQQLELFV